MLEGSEERTSDQRRRPTQLVGALLAVLLVVWPVGVSAAAGFDDVGDDHRFADAIDWLVGQQITDGVDDHRYAPDDTVTRSQMAVFLWRYLDAPDPDHLDVFDDVDPDGWNAPAVAYLNQAGIAHGVTDTHFAGNRDVTREQMATFLWRLHDEPDPDHTHGFDDVPDDASHGQAITWLVDQGVTQGISDTRFDPTGPVTRGQLAAFLWRLEGEPHPEPRRQDVLPGLSDHEQPTSTDEPWYDRAVTAAASARSSVLATYNADELQSVSTGFVVGERHAVTVRHVTHWDPDEPNDMLLVEKDGTRHQAEIVADWAEWDLTLLEVDEPFSGDPLPFGDAQALDEGDPVIQIQNPNIQFRSGGWLTTVGSFSHASDGNTWARMSSQQGGSGAPMLNLDGEVVGISGSGASDDPRSYPERLTVSDLKIRSTVPVNRYGYSGGAGSRQMAELVTPYLPSGDDASTATRASAPASAPTATVGPRSAPAATADTAAVPEDWLGRAHDTAEGVREGTVAVSWIPPEYPGGFIEAGFLVADDLVVTAQRVAEEGGPHGLTVHTIDGEHHDVSVVATEEARQGGVALLRLDNAVDLEPLVFGDESQLEPGAPLLAVSHPQISGREGGWLVTAGPYKMTEGDVVYGDVVVDASYDPNDPFFSGAAGAPMVDLDGEVVGVACCQHRLEGHTGIDHLRVSPFLLRDAVVDDQLTWNGGLGASLVRSLLDDDLPN